MRTISIARLKAHLSAELKLVQAGQSVTVLDHRHPVAVLSAHPAVGQALARVERPRPDFAAWQPLVADDPVPGLLADRSDR